VFEVKPYWKIRGAGYEVTRIIQDNAKQIGCTVFRGRADGVEIEDLSVDCGFQNQQVVNGKIKANASAIGIGGSHIAVRRCLFENYGSSNEAEAGENFAVWVGSPDPNRGENLVVEDCIFTGMSPLVICSSVLTLGGGPPKNDLRAGNWANGVIARRNHITGYHYGCHGITTGGTIGALIVDNVFEHFMGACIYQDTWPNRDIIIAGNIMSDVNQGIRLTCDNMNDFQIRNNILLMNDGHDMVGIAGGVVTTVVEHSLVVGNKVRICQAKRADGTILKDKDVFVTSIATRSSFTYSLTLGGKNETDNAVGGFIQAVYYLGSTNWAPEAIVISDGGRKSPPTNFVIDRNVIKPYNADDKARVPSVGIVVDGLKNSWITNNIVFDSGARDNGTEGFDNLTGKVKPDTGQHADLVISSPKGFTSTVICRDNYHPDGTRLMPRSNDLKLIPGGLSDRDSGVQFAGLRLTHAVDPAGPAKDKNFDGAPGDYAAAADFLYIYTGDGTKHQWKRIAMGDY
jgi:hypothetical protein